MTQRVCIIGGGALGLVVASVLLDRGNSVSMLTGHPSSWQQHIQTEDNQGRIYQGELACISDKAEDIIPNVDIVLLCVPGYLIESSLRQIVPYVTHQAVGSIVSSTGFFFRAHEIFSSSARLFGFQRVPYIARVVEYGARAALLGYKSQLFMATDNLTSSFVDWWADQLNTPVTLLPSYLDASLTNSNPLLHPSRLFGLWHDWKPDMVYPTQSYFYADWDDLSSAMYMDCDAEFQQVCKALGVQVPTVLDYYESHDASSLSHKLRSIEAFKPILAPMKQTESGWIPDLQSRYFTEDFPFGLQLVKDLAIQYQVSTPTIDQILKWYHSYDCAE